MLISVDFQKKYVIILTLMLNNLANIDFIFPERDNIKFNNASYLKDGFRYNKDTKTYTCSLDLPGTNKTNTSIHIELDVMLVKAIRSNGTVYDKLISVPLNIDIESLKAHHIDGVLTITGQELTTKKKSITIL